MEQGISDHKRDRRCPLLKLLPVTRVTGAVFFIHPMPTHAPPFVMVPIEPGLGQVLKTGIFGDKLRRKMIVVVNDGHVFGIPVIEVLRGLIIQ
jgi:hypothetical protein